MTAPFEPLGVPASADASSSPPPAAYVAALAGMPGIGPRRLRVLLHHHDPQAAYGQLTGRVPLSAPIERVVPADVRARLASGGGGAASPADLWHRCQRHGIDIVPFGSERYPEVLLHDRAPPAVLFVRGDLRALDGRRVGLIGTRNATRSGLDTAEALGSDLAANGVGVVSGLARGIDAAAHRGALAAGGSPIAVVGNGPDRPYPASNRDLWERVCEGGVLISEWPPGVAPDAFRFPLRNRIIAALSEVLVVVESRERGGSLSTVREAVERDVTVMAVPGSPRVRASAGTNQLLCDGAPPVTDVADVLVALGLDTRRSGRSCYDARPRPDQLGRSIVELCRVAPRTIDEVVSTLGVTIGDAALAMARLEHAGWLAESGGWFEVLGPWSTVSSSGTPAPRAGVSSASGARGSTGDAR